MRYHLITLGCQMNLSDDRERFLKLFDIVFPMSEVNDLPDSFVDLTVTGSNGLSLEGSMSPVWVTSLAME